MTSGLLGIGRSALLASYAQLQTTGHNIANANTPGYSRQDAVFASAGGTGTGSGFVGRGVTLTDIQRHYDRFLGTELASAQAASSADDARAGQLEQLQRVFADTANGIGAGIDDLNTALADVVNRASDPTARQIVVQRAATLARRIEDVQAQVDRSQAGVDERLRESAERVNELLGRLAGVNQRIATSQGAGHAPNDLLDERDRLVLELSGYLKVTTHEQADGTVSVFTARGEGLLVGNRQTRLGYDAATAPGQLYVENGDLRLSLAVDAVGGGAIAGLMRFRDDDLAALRAGIGALAQQIADTYNGYQSSGVDADGAAGRPMFEYGGPGSSFRSLLTDGRELAAAWPVTAQAGAANTGSVQIAAFAVTGTTSGDAVTIVFDHEAGTYDVQVAGGGAGAQVGVAYVPGQPIEIAGDGWSLSLRGVPATGDTIDVVPNGTPGTDGRNAREMILGAEGLTDHFARIVGDIGARTQSAQSHRASSAMLRDNAQAAQAEYSGVNLDEEAARLLQYQQMYQAAARVIQTAQSMFDTLLAATSR